MNITKYLAISGILMPSVLWLAILILGALTPDYNHIEDAISLLGQIGAPYMIYMNLFGFFTTGILMALFAYGIRSLFKYEKRSLVGPTLVILAGLSFASIGYLPYDVENLSATVNIVHIAAVVLSVSLGAASSVFVYLEIRKGDSILSPLAKPTLYIGLFSLSTISMFFLRDYIGLIQRVNLSLITIWMVIASVRMYMYSNSELSK